MNAPDELPYHAEATRTLISLVIAAQPMEPAAVYCYSRDSVFAFTIEQAYPP